jgi:2-iminobutanoate/2-iminopropanoate deaminase|tara:strand:- start:2509 stop:2910 length:402 start_codon:yes stop_codon:yes gene_type:complete
MPKPNQIYHKRPDIEKGIYYAQACKAGNMLYVSGCVSWDSEGNIIGTGDMTAQVTQVYTDLKETLEMNGLSLKNIIKETVFTTDMDALVANNDVRTQFYLEAESAPPTATWVECTRLVAPEMMIEIECIAQLD